MKKILLVVLLLGMVSLAFGADFSLGALNQRGQSIANEQNEVANELNALHLQNHWATDEEWGPIIYSNEIAVAKITAAGYEYNLCRLDSKGDYCERCSKSLDDAQYEIEKLKAEIKKAKEIKL